MSWVFHLLWMFLVLMLFFIVLRRIYYFGLQVHRPANPSRTRKYTLQRDCIVTARFNFNLKYSTETSQRFTVFTIYQNDRRTAPQPAERSQPPEYTEPPPPPKYDDVIKSPDLFQKPPPYTPTAQA
uniref:Uncharacterized protein n=1 Tax=Anopheles dirus TaxID=7168 RepID=A0A182NGR9_9DIPT